MTSFKNLGWILTASDDDCLVVVGNLQKSQKKWERTLKIMGQEREDARMSGTFFKAVFQAVHQFGSEMWANITNFYY